MRLIIILQVIHSVFGLPEIIKIGKNKFCISASFIPVFNTSFFFYKITFVSSKTHKQIFNNKYVTYKFAIVNLALFILFIQRLIPVFDTK